jgi:antitoxin MazE
MTTTTRKVDERSRVVLPEGFAGRVVSITRISEGELKIIIARTPRKRPSLASLVASITEKNRHDEVDFGPPVGAERT